MRTEQLVRQERPRNVHRVSTALEGQTPPMWELLSSKGKPVMLSSAGFVLHFGQLYQLRVATVSTGETEPDVHLVRTPPFIERQDGPRSTTRHGQEFTCLSFQVHRETGWIRFYKLPTEILFGDLEVECATGEGSNRQRALFGCPVVARSRWSMGLFGLLSMWAVLTWLLGQLQHLAAEWVTRGELPLQSNPHFWIWPLLLAGLYPVCVLFSHVCRLHHRSQELEARYRSRYRPTQ